MLSSWPRMVVRMRVSTSVGIPVDRDRSFWFVVTGDSGLS
jgi:hypothetical protein